MSRNGSWACEEWWEDEILTWIQETATVLAMLSAKVDEREVSDGEYITMFICGILGADVHSIEDFWA